MTVFTLMTTTTTASAPDIRPPPPLRRKVRMVPGIWTTATTAILVAYGVSVRTASGLSPPPPLPPQVIVDSNASRTSSLTNNTDPSGAVFNTTTTFCVIADIPYNAAQAQILKQQLQTEIPTSCQFLLHLGDIRKNNHLDCKLSEYQAVDEIMKLSPIPVFMLLGDNDWSDCTNPDQGLEYFDTTFDQHKYDSKYWTHNLTVTRQLPNQPYNFAIEIDHSIVIGLRLMNGPYPNETAETLRLQDQLTWTKTIIQNYVQRQKDVGRVGRIVIAGHADPINVKKDRPFLDEPFFFPLQEFVKNELYNQIPIMYLNGDLHVWQYKPKFYGQSSMVQVVMAGEGVQAPTIFHIHNNGLNATTETAFSYNRQLPKCKLQLPRSGKTEGVSIYTYLIPTFKILCMERCSSRWDNILAVWPWEIGTCPTTK